jgi:hypothetical protein
MDVMVMDNKKFEFITTDSKWYNQVINLRYRVFYRDLGLPKNIVYDKKENKSIHLICKNSNKVLGYGRLTIKQDIAQISQMAVEPAVQKQGLGMGLMHRLIKKAEEKDCDKIFLNSRLHVINFYKKFGFKTRRDVFISSRSELPHKKMVKIL